MNPILCEHFFSDRSHLSYKDARYFAISSYRTIQRRRDKYRKINKMLKSVCRELLNTNVEIQKTT